MTTETTQLTVKIQTFLREGKERKRKSVCVRESEREREREREW